MSSKTKVLRTSVAVCCIIAISLIGYLAYFIITDTLNPTPKDTFVKNLFIEKDSLDIAQMSKTSNLNDLKMLYNNISKSLKEDQINNFISNTQYQSLWKKLNFAYVDKFINHAFYVFGNSDWKYEDLRFIRNECQSLWNLISFEKGSPLEKKVKEIQFILSKYDEITDFIATNKGFSFLENGLSDRFPISDVKTIISQATRYNNTNLDNKYVNNCARLHDGLNKIPQELFNAHIRYLDNKINEWSGLYSNFSSKIDYENNLYNPLKNEIDALDNGIYDVADFNYEHERLTTKWSLDNSRATSYNYSRR